MAFWRGSRYNNVKTESNFGSGINDFYSPINIEDNQLSTGYNISSSGYPSICSRGLRYLPFNHIIDDLPLGSTGASTSFNGLHCAEGYYTLTVEDSVLRYYAEARLIPGAPFVQGLKQSLKNVNNLPSKMIDFNNGTQTFTLFTNTVSTDNYYITESTPPSSTQSGSVTATTWIQSSTSYPFSILMESFKNRVFSAKDKIIYYSALSNINDWSTPNDAGQLVISDSIGNITGMKEYNDKLLVFTQYSRYELYGDSPENFQLVKAESNIGCISDRSIVKSDNGILYFASLDGIYEYNGSVISKISQNIEKTYLKRGIYTDVACGFHEDRLYVSIEDSRQTLVYDTRFNSWYIESGEFSYYANMRGGSKGVPILFNNSPVLLYDKFIAAENSSELNSLVSISKQDINFASFGETTSVDWYFETKAYNEGVSREQVLYDINVVYEGSTNASMNISYTTNVTNSTYTLIASSDTFTMDNQMQNTRIIMPSTVISNDKWYKLKFSGENKVTVHRLERWRKIKER